MNPIHTTIKIGTIGELLVTLRLLERGVQAAPPIKDSGNDLIAVKGESFRAIQVKTTTTNRFNNLDFPDLFHIAALVHLTKEGSTYNLEESRIFLLEPYEITQGSYSVANLTAYELTQARLDMLFGIGPGDVEVEFIEEDNYEGEEAQAVY